MFNDCLAAGKFSKLVKAWGIKVAVETGTHEGIGTLGMAAHVPIVFTIEIDPAHRATAIAKFIASGYVDADRGVLAFNERVLSKGDSTIFSYLGNSPEVLKWLLSNNAYPGRWLAYLDAHWQSYWPLLDELKTLAAHNMRDAVIIIHDFKVPNHPELVFDNHNGFDLDLAYAEKDLMAINPHFVISFNDKAEGNKRGILYATP